jgi:putative transposase
VKFSFIAKHRGVWPAGWLCEALGVSRGGFYAWLTRPRSQRSRSDEELGARVRASFLASDRTYGARRVWRDLLADGLSCGLHRIERLMRLQALKARPRRRRLPPDLGERQAGAVAPNVLDRAFEAAAPNRKWIADFTYVWTAEGWLYVRFAASMNRSHASSNRVSSIRTWILNIREQRLAHDIGRTSPKMEKKSPQRLATTSLTRGNVARILASRTCRVETGLVGWCGRTRT